MHDLVARPRRRLDAAWYEQPDDAHELRERIARVHEALAAAGRPRASLELTAGIFLTTSAAADDDRPDETITAAS